MHIENLRPVYTVTFALSGFGTVRREGIELSGTFIATVNAELRVGAVEKRSPSRAHRLSSTCRAPTVNACSRRK